MPKVKLELNEPFEGALKYAKGKYYESTIPGNPGATMYSLETGDVLFLEHTICDEPDELFRNAKVAAHQAFSITVRKRNGQRYYEVRAQGHAEPVAPPSRLESQLRASIDHVKSAQRANPTPEPPATQAPSSTALSNGGQHSNAIPQGHTKASYVMGAALIAAMDAWRMAQSYAQQNGFILGPASPEDLRAIAATLYIQAAKDPLFNDRGMVKQEAAWQH